MLTRILRIIFTIVGFTLALIIFVPAFALMLLSFIVGGIECFIFSLDEDEDGIFNKLGYKIGNIIMGYAKSL